MDINNVVSHFKNKAELTEYNGNFYLGLKLSDAQNNGIAVDDLEEKKSKVGKVYYVLRGTKFLYKKDFKQISLSCSNKKPSKINDIWDLDERAWKYTQGSYSGPNNKSSEELLTAIAEMNGYLSVLPSIKELLIRIVMTVEENKNTEK